jgi:hypothetical protein
MIEKYKDKGPTFKCIIYIYLYIYIYIFKYIYINATNIFFFLKDH